MYLFLDLETSGLPDPTRPAGDPCQPWPVQIAAELCRLDGTAHSWMNVRVKADGRVITAGATEVHGITTREADRSGWSERIAIAGVVQMARDAHAVIGFGIKFDTFVVENAIARAGGTPRTWIRPGLQKIDLIVPAANAAQLPPSDHPSNTYRWPKLTTAAAILLDENPNMAGAHDAWTDMQRAKRIFFHLKTLGMIELHDGIEDSETRDRVPPVGGAEAAAPA